LTLPNRYLTISLPGALSPKSGLLTSIAIAANATILLDAVSLLIHFRSPESKPLGMFFSRSNSHKASLQPTYSLLVASLFSSRTLALLLSCSSNEINLGFILIMALMPSRLRNY
jgi:hypothetical protein